MARTPGARGSDGRVMIGLRRRGPASDIGVDELDDAAQVEVAISIGDVHRECCGRGRPERRRGSCYLGGRLRQPQVLQHQLAGKARLEAVARCRARHGARHRAHLAQDERAGRRGRQHVVERLAVDAQLLAHDETLGGRQRDDAGHHVVADLDDLAETGAATMHDVLAHALQQGQRLLKHGLVATAHEGQGRGFGAGNASRDRRVQHGIAALGCGGVNGTRGLDVDGRGVDQHGFPIRRGDDSVVQKDLTDIGADRQHGDDEVDALCRVLTDAARLAPDWTAKFTASSDRS